MGLRGILVSKRMNRFFCCWNGLEEPWKSLLVYARIPLLFCRGGYRAPGVRSLGVVTEDSRVLAWLRRRNHYECSRIDGVTRSSLCHFFFLFAQVFAIAAAILALVSALMGFLRRRPLALFWK